MLLCFQKLDQRRARLGMTKMAVARMARVSLPTVNRILSGKEHAPSFPNLHAIARTLGVVIHLGAGDEIEIKELTEAEEFRLNHAQKKASWLVRMVQGTMALEAQAVDSTTLKQLIEQTAQELLRSKRKLWGD